MGGYQTARLPVPGLLEWLAALLRAVLRMAVIPFEPERARTERKADGRAEINRRAENILDTYGDSILRYAYSYLHNMSDAEEVLQDTLVQFLKTAPAFENRQHEKAWLMRVAANLSKNRLDYNAVRRADELNDELVAQEREDLSFVWCAVKQLPVKYREVIHLFYQEGWSTGQIAKALQMNEATVRSNLHRGRAKLRELLKGEYDFA